MLSLQKGVARCAHLPGCTGRKGGRAGVGPGSWGAGGGRGGSPVPVEGRPLSAKEPGPRSGPRPTSAAYLSRVSTNLKPEITDSTGTLLHIRGTLSAKSPPLPPPHPHCPPRQAPLPLARASASAVAWSAASSSPRLPGYSSSPTDLIAPLPGSQALHGPHCLWGKAQVSQLRPQNIPGNTLPHAPGSGSSRNPPRTHSTACLSV